MRPTLSYEIIAWQKRTELRSTKKALVKVQKDREVLRSYLNAAVEVIFKLTPLHIIVKKATKLALFRIVMIVLDGKRTINRHDLQPVAKIIILVRDSIV